MEKFYKIKPESKLYVHYQKWKADQEKIIEYMKDFLNQYELPKNTKYGIYSNQMLIERTPEVIETIGKYLGKELSNGASWIKGNLKIAHEIKRDLEQRGIKCIDKPEIWHYMNDFSSGRFRNRLFVCNGELYASMEADRFEIMEGIADEINGSEFYKIIEQESERRINCYKHSEK